MTGVTSYLPHTLDALGLLGLKVAFVLAAIAPIVVVLIYRWVRVRARLKEVTEIMTAAFGRPNEKTDEADPQSVERSKARMARANNPYFADLATSFGNSHNWWRYAFPLLSLTILTLTICAILYAWVRIQLWPAWGGGPIAHLPAAVAMALAGGYIWSLYRLVSRCDSDELGPSDLGEIGVGLLSCVPIGYAFSLLALEGYASFAAFVASSFPMRETQRLLQEQALKRALGSEVAAKTPRPTERHLGMAIDGVSDQTLVRLAELRIVTVLDMAYSDPIKIMLRTGYALPLIVDWIDQSLWALYVGENRAEMIKHGIRCSLDAYEFVELHCLWNKAKNERGVTQGADKLALEFVAGKLGTTPELAQDMFLRIYADPQVIVLRRLWYVLGAPAQVTTQKCP